MRTRTHPEQTEHRSTCMTTQQVFDSYLAAVTAGERRNAFDVIREARGAGHELRALYLEVFQPTLRRVGELWQENRLTVAEEHFATAITQTAMLHLYGEVQIPDSSGPLLIAACAATERHEVGLRMLCDFLDLEGWQTIFLGASVPTESLIEMIARKRPDAVALSATIAPHLPQLRATIGEIRAAAGDRQPVILAGGRPFLDQPELAGHVGADLTASDAALGADLLRDRFS
jgi:methanogenic corrinoid protein MtbC1